MRHRIPRLRLGSRGIAGRLLPVLACLCICCLPAFAAWQLALGGVDVTGAAAPLERGDTVLVNITTLAALLNMRVAAQGSSITIHDPYGVEWQTRDGSLSLQGGGRTLPLAFPAQLQGSALYLPLDAVNTLAGRQLTLTHGGTPALATAHTGATDADGWQEIDLAKPVAPGVAPGVVRLLGAGVFGDRLSLPPTTDLLHLGVDLGLAQGAEGLALNAWGKYAGDEVVLNAPLTHAAAGLQSSNAYLSIMDRERGLSIEAGTLASDLLGSTAGVRYAWQAGAARWPALSLYCDKQTHRLALAYSDDLPLARGVSLGGEVSTEGGLSLRARYQPDRLGIYATGRLTPDPAQSGASLYTSYTLHNGVMLGGGVSRAGAGADGTDWRDLSVQIPLHANMSLLLDHLRTSGQEGTDSADAATLVLPVGPLRVLTRLQLGHTSGVPALPLDTPYRQVLCATGYSMTPRLRFDVQASARTQGGSAPQNQSWTQLVSTYQFGPRSTLQVVNALTNPLAPEQLHLRLSHTWKDDTSLALDYGQLTPLTAAGSAPASAPGGQGFTLTLHTQWGMKTPARGAVVAGRVVDQTGRPLVDCLVRLGDYCTATDHAGHYAFPRVPPGAYDLSLDARSMPADARPLEGARHLRLTSRDRLTVDFHVQPLRAITGWVYLDRNGNGNMDAGEGLGGIALHLGATVTASEPDGAFGFYNVAPGDYAVTLDTAHLPEGVQPSGPVEMHVTLHPESGVTGVAFRLEPHDKAVIFQE